MANSWSPTKGQDLSKSVAVTSKEKQSAIPTQPSSATTIRVKLITWLWMHNARSEILQGIINKYRIKLKTNRVSEEYIEVTVTSEDPWRFQENERTATLELQGIVDHYTKRRLTVKDISGVMFDDQRIDQKRYDVYICNQTSGQKLLVGDDKRKVDDLYHRIMQDNQAASQDAVPATHHHAPAPAPVIPPFRELNMKYKNKTTVHIFKADITSVHADVIVAASDGSLDLSVGVANAISRAAGPELQQECKSMYDKNGPLAVGHSIITKGYKLPSKYVIHVVGPNYSKHDPRECNKMMYDTFTRCLSSAEKLNVKTVAIPAVSSGASGVPIEIVAKQMCLAVTHHVGRKDCGLTGILLVDLDKTFLSVLRREFITAASSDLVEI